MPDRVALIVLDGFGLRESAHGNAIRAARTPTLDRVFREHAWTRLATSGEEVGLPAGQMGNSEVGHMNIGAGRVIYQTLTRIDKSVRDGDFFENTALVAAVEAARSSGDRLHLFGLLSDGGVHSSQAHAHALLDLATRRGLTGDRVLVHAFTDGRDTSPTGGAGFVAALDAEMDRLGTGRVATVGGRYHAMDRDRRWERTRRAWDAIVHARAPPAESAAAAIAESYAKGVTDEFVEPRVVLAGYGGVRDGDSVISFNFRPDRARQLTRAFTQPGFAEFETGPRPRVRFASMTKYDDTFGVPFAFPDERPRDTLGEVVARAGLAQLRVAETEKYAHVTYFFNGGEERPFEREERVLVQSPKHVPTYDHAPEMSAAGVADAVVRSLDERRHDLVVANFANCDMVGHTGDFAATVRAVETVDACLARILDAAARAGAHAFITADHGNAEEMVNPDGSPQTAHTTLPVPLAHVPPPGARPRALRPGVLADVAPTILAVMGLPQPAAMSGSPLFAR